MAFREEALNGGNEAAVVDAQLAAIKSPGTWRTADLSAADAALCAFAEQVTARPAECNETHVERLREAGFDDVAVHDAAQVIAYFNYINRIADCLGVDLEPEMKAE